jgi:Protein of unknown function (DUF3558)
MKGRTALGCLMVMALLAGCGSEAAAPPGSPEKPLQARPSGTGTNAAREPGSARAPKLGYQALLQRQASRPGRRFTPCSLVTRAQARVILGQPVLLLSEAPQGPTCIYRAKRKGFVTLGVQQADFAKAKRNLRHATKVDLGSRTGMCGQYGRPTLYAPLSQGRMLTVAAQCDVARRFAAQAVRSLGR